MSGAAVAGPPPREAVTGLVLAGGLARRMGGVDKGLLLFRGRPLAQHALERLRPQVGPLLLNANRHLERHAAFGVPVLPDAVGGFPGPLAGLLAGLAHATTPWLACVPCDGPAFPADLVARLAAAVGDAELAIAVSGAQRRPQPVYMLLRCTLRGALQEALSAGERKVEAWAAARRCVHVPFDDEAAFANANTPDELRRLEASSGD